LKYYLHVLQLVVAQLYHIIQNRFKNNHIIKKVEKLKTQKGNTADVPFLTS